MGVAVVALVQYLFERTWRGVLAPGGATDRLVVARVDARGGGGLGAVAERHRGVVKVLGNDPRAADRVRALAQVGVAERGGELAQLHREVRELHLAGERVVERAAAPLPAVDGDRVPWLGHRREETESPGVVPGRVAGEDACADR